MATVDLIEYEDASDEVREIYDDIRALRKTDFINNFWKGLANNPDQLRRTWEGMKEVMAPGALDPLAKEMLGDMAYNHLLNFARVEQASFDNEVVTDWERKRYFERI